MNASSASSAQQRARRVEPERHLEDLHHRQVDPADDDAVDRETEIERPETAEERRRPASVADLRELDVGHHAGATPQARVDEHREHAARGHVPPQPVAGNAVARDDPRDQQRRVGGKGRGHHRRAGEPPGDVAAREKELRRAAAGAPRVVQPDRQVEREIGGDDQPVEQRQCHKSETAIADTQRNISRSPRAPRYITEGIVKRPPDRAHLVERAATRRAVGQQHEVPIPSGIDPERCSGKAHVTEGRRRHAAAAGRRGQHRIPAERARARRHSALRRERAHQRRREWRRQPFVAAGGREHEPREVPTAGAVPNRPAWPAAPPSAAA